MTSTAWDWILQQAQCTGCGICADLCPHDAIAMPRALGFPRPGPQPCTGCMICVRECPFEAIDVRETTLAHP